MVRDGVDEEAIVEVLGPDLRIGGAPQVLVEPGNRPAEVRREARLHQHFRDLRERLRGSRRSERAPKVLWVSPTISSSFGGPTTTAVNGLVAEKRAGLESSLISTRSDDDEAQVAPALARLAADGIDVRLFPRTKLLAKAEAWGFSPRMAVWMVRHLREYDIVHLQYVWCMSSICGAILSRIYGIPLVITPHESLTDYDIDVASKSRIKRRVKLTLRRLYLRTADRLVFMSELEERDTRYGSTPAQLISHAVQEEAVPVEPHGPVRPDGPLRIGFLGRNIPKKGIDLIIGALGRNRDRDWKLLIAGPPGTDEFVGETKELAESLGVAANVEWLGFLDKRDGPVRGLRRPGDAVGLRRLRHGGRGSHVLRRAGDRPAEQRSRGDRLRVRCRDRHAGIVGRQPRTGPAGRWTKARSRGASSRENGLEAANSKLTYEAYAAGDFRALRLFARRIGPDRPAFWIR